MFKSSRMTQMFYVCLSFIFFKIYLSALNRHIFEKVLNRSSLLWLSFYIDGVFFSLFFLFYEYILNVL